MSARHIHMDTDFPRKIYAEAKRLFQEGAVETLVSRSSCTVADGGMDSAVKLVHVATGEEILCDDFPSQIENFIAAAIRLRIQCDNRDTKSSS